MENTINLADAVLNTLIDGGDGISVKQLMDKLRAMPELKGSIGGRDKFIEKLKGAGFTLYESFATGNSRAALRVTV